MKTTLKTGFSRKQGIDYATAKRWVNTICSGFTATREGASEPGARPVSESVDGIVWAATLPDDAPTGSSLGMDSHCVVGK